MVYFSILDAAFPSNFCFQHSSNFAVEWFTTLLRAWDLVGSKIGLENYLSGMIYSMIFLRHFRQILGF